MYMKKMSKQYWNDLTTHALHLVNALNKELGPEACYLDPISTKMLIKFKGCAKKSHVMVYLKNGELTFSEMYLKGLALEHIETVKSIINPANFYSIIDNVKKLNPEIINEVKRGRGRPAGYKTSEDTKLKQRKARLKKLSEQEEPNNIKASPEDIEKLKSFIFKMRPIHQEYIKKNPDTCWKLHGLLFYTKQRIKDLNDNGITIKQLNDAIKNVLDGKIEENAHKKLKNILNDILTIIK